MILTFRERVTKPLLVGELNATSADPRHALSPFPPHRSGGRLAKILGMTAKEYVRSFDRVNLCEGSWSIVRARAEANTIALTARERPCIVLLGEKVASAFGVSYRPFTAHERWPGEYGWKTNVVLLPHPSGLNRLWNDPDAAYKARQLVYEFALDIRAAA